MKKPILEVRMGEIFKIYPNQERYFTLDSNKIDDDNEVLIREYMGGKGFASSWLGERNNCHVDINVEIVASLPENF